MAVRAACDRFCSFWRSTLEEPGFAVLTLEFDITSRSLRKLMIDIARALPLRFAPERLGRFDQQVTSRFHRDGAPNESLLLLGYEPSEVSSSLFVGDAWAAATEHGRDVDSFLAAFNPMIPAGEAALAPFVTSFDLPPQRAVIAIINNSHLFGVLHKATVRRPNATERRVINSVGLALQEPFKTIEEVQHFLDREDLD